LGSENWTVDHCDAGITPSAQQLVGGKGVSAINMDKTNPKEVQGGYQVIFRAWYLDKDGNKVYAKDFGKKAWPLKIPKSK
jgi:hypothetical protein